jgi:hypothetical protein
MGLVYRNEFLLAIECYRGGMVLEDMPGLSKYEQRQRREALETLVRHFVLKKGEQSGKYELIELDGSNSVAILDYDYSQLSLNEIKMLITLYVLVSHHRQRESFIAVVTQESLCKATGIKSREHVSCALNQLSGKTLLRQVSSNERRKRLNDRKKENPDGYSEWFKSASKFWTGQGSAIYLMDPTIGEDIHNLDRFFRNRMASMEPCAIYEMCLSQYDPKGIWQGPFKGLRDVLFNCPLSNCHARKPSLRLTCLEREDGSWEDHWKCFGCGHGGNALSLGYKTGILGSYKWRLLGLKKEMLLEPQQYRPAEEYTETKTELENERQTNAEHDYEQ